MRSKRQNRPRPVGNPSLSSRDGSNDDSVVAAVRLLPPDRDRLQRLADENERSLSGQIRLMIKRGLEQETG